MTYLHQELDLGPDDTLEVTLDGPANVMLLDPADFERYRRGESFRYQGGFAERSQIRLNPPRGGRWNVVVDLGGHAGHVRARIRLL